MRKTTVIVRRRDLKKEKQRKLFGLCGFLLVAVFSAVLLTSVIPSDASGERGRIKYYTSVEIVDGDSLTSIADSHMSEEYEDRAAYIRELCAINHLMTDSTIHSGQYLIVPYYADMD